MNKMNISRRDYFAVHALRVIVPNSDILCEMLKQSGGAIEAYSKMAEASYQLADAMIKHSPETEPMKTGSTKKPAIKGVGFREDGTTYRYAREIIDGIEYYIIPPSDVRIGDEWKCAELKDVWIHVSDEIYINGLKTINRKIRRKVNDD